MNRIDTPAARITNPKAAGAIIRRPVAGDTVLVQVFDATGLWWRPWVFVSREVGADGMSTTSLRVPNSTRVTETRGAYNVHRVMPVLAA